ncbi:LacI family DNA-binding transcriptional regulator [Tropicimonas sp. IMCC34043]|uniref:LacI family DNA-binding transcriptional regulator n=1 Tax=Tropicimonas sp. IMCC34043 TaxID=2248760 RepID=UPI0018E55C16|nr:LacI family DNA-binding transcriptional regulator [Tropicimonas sp. IMCC34043]
MDETDQRVPRNRRGSNATGIRDVARLAGVSTATVSRAFNAPETVSEKIRQQVEQAARTLSYIPHNAARALSSQRSRTLGIVIPTVQNSIFAEQVEWLQRRALSHGYTTLVAHSGFTSSGEAEQVRQLVRNGIDGIMLVGADHLAEVYSLLQSRRIAYVNTSVCDPASPHPSVGFDNGAAMAHTTNYLLSLGHRNIGVISGDIHNSDRARLRLQGVLRAMAEAEVALPNERIAHSDYSMEASRAACRDLLSRAPETTAIMCHNDVQAFAALLELQRLGFVVPRDISVTGFDDLEWARHLQPALTTIRVPWGRMAQIAADMLVAQLDRVEYRHSTMLDFDLVVRESTAPPRPAAQSGI